MGNGAWGIGHPFGFSTRRYANAQGKWALALIIRFVSLISLISLILPCSPYSLLPTSHSPNSTTDD
ncbi:hypothetical protein [Nostoc sp. CHAB 5715]|uniref:hypothetical protein n=1 Tax=Nostoc sp. CHAB 5715 TaxID=2780400 RepID=UPI001E3CEC90|nr:hypothetical protein [Nostoc sp. CHAB 5715]MCC5619889.1 hypothetical protein [Nostoc sp. CHAB 5715]